MADEHEEKPEADTSEDKAGGSSQETAAGHSVVEETAAEPARETAVGHQVVDAGAAEKESGATEVSYSHEEPEPAAAAPPADSGGTSPAAADREAAEARDSFTDKPEVFVAVAFLGAFVVGKLLRKLTRSDA